MSKYRVFIKHQDGTHSYLTFNNRTVWCLRRAEMHRNDFVANMVAGYFPHIAGATLEAV